MFHIEIDTYIEVDIAFIFGKRKGSAVFPPKATSEMWVYSCRE
jgi:hypothetical protein